MCSRLAHSCDEQHLAVKLNKREWIVTKLKEVIRTNSKTIKMTSHPPPYEKFQNPDEPGAGQVPAGYPGYPGAPITLNQTVNAAPPGQHTVVVTQPAVSNAVIVTAPIRPASYMWLSCVVYWCCNWIAGGIAFALSLASSNAADENRMEEARSYGRASLWTSVIGIIITAILGIILVIIYVTYWSKLEQDIENNLNDNYNSYNG